MRALASSLGAWRSIEKQEGIKHVHGLTFPLAVVEAIGRPHGLELVADEQTSEQVDAFDAVFVSVMDTRNLVDVGDHFRRWKLPVRAAARSGRPLVWAGGQGLFNPRPFGAVADLIVVGDAEPSLPQLLDLWGTHGNGATFLRAAAAVPGVWVPSVHDADQQIDRGVAEDISVTLTNHIDVSANATRRVEIARGCKFNCSFCGLGNRQPLRENPGEAIIAEIKKSPKVINLQAGDAESHTDIVAIRQALKAHGGHDTGWTGRTDTVHTDDEIDANKRFAFGVEGMTWFTRRIAGKGHLTDDRLVSDTVRTLDAIQGDWKGRIAWHLIAGFPGEQSDDVFDLLDVLHRINDEIRKPRNLSLHWQPFSPTSGTPLQWFATGGGARRLAGMIEDGFNGRRLGVIHRTGRTNDMARLCTVLGRADERAVDVFELQRPSVDDAMAATGATWQTLDPNEPLPWDFAVTPEQRSTWRKRFGWAQAQLENKTRSHHP